MSFANQVRSELARLNPDRSCCRKAELAALLILNGFLQEDEGSLLLGAEVENAALARKLFLLLKEEYGIQASVSMAERRRFRKTRVYEIKLPFNQSGQTMLEEMGLFIDGAAIRPQAKWKLLNRNCCRRAFLRGVFLSRGFISRPEGHYHLEIVLTDTVLAAQVQRLMARLGLKSRLTERKTNPVIYLKEAERIVDFLRIVGASKAVLDFENARILKSMRNTVNRQVNFETANLVKTVDASLRQTASIRQLVDARGWEAIPPSLRTLARLRLEFPDSSLKELGDMMAPALTKSGVAYRMRKLEEMAEELLPGQ